MEIDDLKELVQLLKDTDITELLIEKDGLKVKLRREKFFAPLERQPVVPHVERKEVQEEVAEEEEPHGLITITSPIVGTFYRASSPESPSFVEVGTRVKKGQTLCIIEAMKLMNEIESEFDGVIAKILVENGHPVEYGEPLFLVEPA